MSHLETTDLVQKCTEAGLRMTDQRRVILQVLAEAADHPSVEVVHQRSREIDPSISIATVYRTLNLLDQLNLVRKHDFHESHARFEANVEHHQHHHLIDVESGEVIEFKDDELEGLVQKIASRLGFGLVDRRLELYGKKRGHGRKTRG